MLSSSPVPKEAVFLLADHLDAALAVGEDLQTARLDPMSRHDGDVDAEDEAQAMFIARLGRLEAALLGRIMQARRRVAELPARDAAIRPLAQLFVGSTDIVLSLVERLGDKTQARFEAGQDRLPFLRARGLLAAGAPALDPDAAIEVGEDYRIAGVIELGPLMDMVSSLLTALDTRYDLYGDIQSGGDVAAEEPAAAPDASDDLADIIQRMKAEAERGEVAAGTADAADTVVSVAEAEPVTPDTLMAAIEKLGASTPAEPAESPPAAT